jgi:predicted heme/steroid binding protein
MQGCFNKYICKIDRLSAWGLFIVMVTYFVSGYGMTKGLIPAEIAVRLHNNLLPLLAMFFFVIHTSYAIHLALKRWRIWNVFTKTFLILAYVAFLVGFVYVDRFYQKSVTPSATNTTSTNLKYEDDDEDGLVVTNPTNSGINNTQANTTAKTFTLSELAQYDGLNGRSPYVAVDGVVYDMTGVFTSGYHFGHKAGTDLSNAFYLKHVKSAITKYPVVGTLQ